LTHQLGSSIDRLNVFSNAILWQYKPIRKKEFHFIMPTDAIIQSKIRTIPDYPKKGIMFRDITTLLKDPEGFRLMIGELKVHCLESNTQYDTVVGIEARGFIVEAALAHALSCGFIPVRKPGKLPALTIAQEYTLETHINAIEKV
jgi:adenine phosphoribosyltransferase